MIDPLKLHEIIVVERDFYSLDPFYYSYKRLTNEIMENFICHHIINPFDNRCGKCGLTGYEIYKRITKDCYGKCVDTIKDDEVIHREIKYDN
jgi:hypothetical protein